MAHVLDDEQKELIVSLLQEGLLTYGQIAARARVSKNTVWVYSSRLRKGEALPGDDTHLSLDTRVKNAIKAGATAEQLKLLYDVDDAYIQHRWDEVEREGINVKGNEMWQFLQKNWHWEQPKPRAKRSKDGYRIVRKGDRSRLRTPYRPDGRFH